jgi:hypothetical protein
MDSSGLHVTSQWLIWLDLSTNLVKAASLVLCLNPKPILGKAVCELFGVWDGVWVVF